MIASTSSSMAGVDGCRNGWVVAFDDDGRVTIDVVASIAEIAGRCALVGVDMPIGLPATWGRAADDEARRFLSPRGSTIFPTLPRSLLDLDATYAELNARSRAEFGKGLTQQTFHLVKKLIEVDVAVAASPLDRIIEVHPECSFKLLGGTNLGPKKQPSGRAQRLDLLRPIFGDVVDTHRRDAGDDDVLDALAVLWTARRYARGEHRTFGGDEYDERGLVMRIVA